MPPEELAAALRECAKLVAQGADPSQTPLLTQTLRDFQEYCSSTTSSPSNNSTVGHKTNAFSVLGKMVGAGEVSTANKASKQATSAKNAARVKSELSSNTNSQSKPPFQRPVNPKSSLIANGWLEQQRRSKMRVVWKDVLASLVQGRTPQEETTLWIQREVTHNGTTSLEALHQIPVKWLEKVQYLDDRFAIKVYNLTDEFLFRTNDADAAQNWVLTLRSAQQLAQKGKDFTKNKTGVDDWDKTTAEEKKEKEDVTTTSSTTTTTVHKISVKEMRAIAHGAGISTHGMERGELERVVAQIANGGGGGKQPSDEMERRQKLDEQREREIAERKAAEEKERLRVVEERRKAEERRRQDEIQQKASEEEARRLEAEDRKRLEDERKQKEAEEELRRRTAERVKAQQEAEVKRREEEERRRLEAERLRREEEEIQRRLTAKRAEEERRRQEEAARQQQEAYRRQHEAWQRQQHEEAERRRVAEQHAAEERRRQEEAYRRQQEAWHRSQQQQQAHPPQHPHAQWQQQHPQQQHYPQQQHVPPHGGYPQQHYPQQPHPQHPPGQNGYHSPPPQQQSSPMSMKYAKMANQTEDDGQKTIGTIKHGVLVEWALQPPTLQTLRPIEILITTIHGVFPPKFGCPGHEYFGKWSPVKIEEVTDSNRPDDEKLKKTIRKLRFFLHPDKLPRDLSPEQSFMCKMLWDITSDAWEEHKKKEEDLGWIRG